MRRLLLALLLPVLALLPAIAEDSVYVQALAGFAGNANRLPGSAGWESAAANLEKVLAAHGVELQRQRYRTAVPETRACRLAIDGVEVPGVLPLAPDAAAPTTTWGGPLEGELVYLADGSAPRLVGKRIAGSIAVLDLGSSAMRDVFALGAKAIVFVGDDATQWTAAWAVTGLQMSIPRAWLPRAAAEKAGLLDGATHRASLTIDTTWKPVDTANLWALIKAAPDTDAESASQTIVLGAQLGTFGLVPDLCPQQRWAANCALLADAAARLQAERPKRNVLVVFLGSHYAAQDGARVLYWVANKVILGSRDKDPLAGRVAAFRAEAEGCDRRIAAIADEKFIASGDDIAFGQVQKLRQLVVGEVNNLNYEIRIVQLDRHALLGKGRIKPEDLAPAQRAELAALDARDEVAKKRKHTLNELRRQIFEQRIADHGTFAELTGRMRAQLQEERAAALRLEQESSSSLALFTAIDGQTVMAHLGLDLAAADRPWLLNPFAARSMAFAREPNPGLFAKQARAAKLAFDAVPADIVSAPLFTPDASVAYQVSNLCTPRPLLRPSTAAIALGVYGAQLQTIGDPLDSDELPVAGSWDLSRLAPQTAAFARTLAAAEFPLKTGLSPSNFYDEKFVGTCASGKWRGLQLVNYCRGSEDVEGTAKRALAFVQFDWLVRAAPLPDTLVGASPAAIAYAEPSGHLFSPGVIDDWTGGMVHAFGFAEGGWIDRATVRDTSKDFQARMFYAQGGGMLTTFTPDSYIYASELRAFDARTDAEPKHFLRDYAQGGHTLWTNQDRKVKIIGGGLTVLGIDPDSKDPSDLDGAGVVLRPEALLSMDPVAQSARDYSALNHQRMDVLRRSNLVNKPVERLQADADDHLDGARDARGRGELALAAAHDTAAVVLANRAYRPLKDNANDLLRAVVILLVLSIPFAFAAERLVFGSPSIYRQIAGFCGIFCGTFAILYNTHPAFALASAPIVIFLAFVIILLSSFVIAVVMGKFKQELKAMQGLATKAHSAGSENSTAFAAVVIGISGMRNRPLKTFLTVVTVTLLTFTILVFASFESTLGVQETYLGKSRGTDRIELHLPSFQTIPGRLSDSIAEIYGDRFTVVRRTASFRDPANGGLAAAAADVLWNPAARSELRLDAVLGVTTWESAHLRGLFPALGSDAAPLYLSTSAAKSLGVAPGAEVVLRGRTFHVVGTFDETAMQAVENIDGTRLMPPNFDATFASLNVADEQARRMLLSSIDPGMFIFCQAGMVAVTTPEALASLSPVENFLALYPKPGVDVEAAARELAALFNGPVYASTADGAKRHFYTSLVSGSGYMELIVPLLLGGLIIFSSLLGSIVDRQKEIFTFSALGLAPKDVGTLFFAESAVIAVLGGLGGYLVSQVLVKILAVLASFGLATVPAVNFSSTSSLMTILIVMAMVMLSTIYPALMASRSANPGVNRSWKFPKPEGDVLRFTFPFTVPERSFAGILGFIREHFEAHGDASLDVFSARRPEIHRVAGDPRRLGIGANVSLAPFDLGVLQRFEMHTRASDIPGIDEVVVVLTRLNGAPGTWLKGNRTFIDDLRNQFLIWRSLPPETVEHYQRATADDLAARPLVEGGNAHG